MPTRTKLPQRPRAGPASARSIIRLSAGIAIALTAISPYLRARAIARLRQTRAWAVLFLGPLLFISLGWWLAGAFQSQSHQETIPLRSLSG